MKRQHCLKREFNYPTEIADEGDVYVVDRGNKSVQISRALIK